MAEITAEDDTSFGGHPSSSSRPPVTNISQWIERFSVMAVILVTCFPEKAPEFLAYQALIARSKRNYEGLQWVIYDRQYRRDALARKDLNWSVLNSRLYNEAITGRARAIPRCTNCLGDDHTAGSCPLNPSFNVVGVAPSPSPTYRQGGLSEICRNFNSARCRRVLCRYQHLCLGCNGSHPYTSCPQRRPLTRPQRGHSPTRHRAASGFRQ